MYQYAIIYKTVTNAQNGAAGDPSGASESAGLFALVFMSMECKKMEGNANYGFCSPCLGTNTAIFSSQNLPKCPSLVFFEP